MRISKLFTIDDLVALASTKKRSVSRANVGFYVRLLKNAGYIQPHGRLLQLTKDTGPKPPQILRIKEVYDANLNEIMYREVPESES